MSEKHTSSKFHFVIDFGEDLTLEHAEHHLETLLKNRALIIEDAGIATDRLLGVYLTQKEFELLCERAKYEGGYLGVCVRKIIQKSLSEWEKEGK